MNVIFSVKKDSVHCLDKMQNAFPQKEMRKYFKISKGEVSWFHFCDEYYLGLSLGVRVVDSCKVLVSRALGGIPGS